MKFLKEKKGIIISFIIGVILASSITVYAYSYMASDIGYTKPGTNTEISVETALNDLYSKNVKIKSGTLVTTQGDNNIDVGFVPSKIVFTISTDGTTCVYNSDKSATQTYTCHADGIATFSLNSDANTSSHIKSLGTTTVFRATSSGATWYWFAIE